MADLIAASLEDRLFAVLISRQKAELAHILTERILLASRKQFQGNTTVNIDMASFPRDATTNEAISAGPRHWSMPARTAAIACSFSNMRPRSRGSSATRMISCPPQQVELIAWTKSLINVKRLNDNLASIEEVLFPLANAVGAKDSCTHGHIERVASIAVILGYKLSLCTS